MQMPRLFLTHRRLLSLVRYFQKLGNSEELMLLHHYSHKRPYFIVVTADNGFKQ